ncbi:MAG: LptF/LptG family permease [bacterium]
MRILDWYTLRRFCFTLGHAMGAFVLVVIFVDMIGNLGKFIDKEVPNIVIAKYYLFYAPYILILAMPIAMLLSSLFSLGQMANHGELTAIKSAGIALHRILLPLFAFSLLVSLAVLGFGEEVVPEANQAKTKIKKEYLDSFKARSQAIIKNIFWRDEINRRIFIGEFNTKNNKARKVSVQTESANNIIERIDAPDMQWQDSTWVLYQGYKRTFEDEKETVVAFDKLKEVLPGIRPEELERIYTNPEDMSFTELRDFIEEVKRNGGDPRKWQVDLHFKLSIPLANFIMVLFGAPLAASRRQGGAVFSFIVSLLICLVYYGTTRVVQTLGHTDVMPTVLSAWFTNGLFTIVGLATLFFSRK